MINEINSNSINYYPLIQPIDAIYSLGGSISDLASRVNDYVRESILIQFVLGAALGMVAGYVTFNFLTLPVVTQLLGVEKTAKILAQNPFADMKDMDFIEKFFLSIEACIGAPILEEIIFRGFLMDAMGSQFNESFREYFPEDTVQRVAQVATILFSSIIFGVVHFFNAIAFSCSPVLLLPQVINATFGGIGFAIAKELTADCEKEPLGPLRLPIYMHFGNNLMYCIQLFI